MNYDISFTPPAMAAPSPDTAAAPAVPTVDYSTWLEQAATPNQEAPTATTPALDPSAASGLDPELLAIAENLKTRYGSVEAMQEEARKAQEAEAVEKAQSEVYSRFAPLLQDIENDLNEGLITEEVAARQKQNLNAQYQLARQQAETLAKYQPVVESVTQQQQAAQRNAQVEGAVANMVAAQPELKGAEAMLRNALIAGKAAPMAAAEVLATVRNLRGAAPLPTTVPTGLPVPTTNSQPTAVAGQRPQLPDPLADPVGFAQAQAQIMAAMQRRANA